MLLVEEHTGDVKNITCPTLIIHGDKDDIVPKDSVLYVYNTIAAKSVTLVEIKTLTHDLFINNRYEEVKELITNFLRKKPKFGKYTKKIWLYQNNHIFYTLFPITNKYFLSYFA